MAYTFNKRIGPTKYGKVKNLKYYNTPNPFSINSSTGGNCTWYAWGRFWEVLAGVKSEYKTKRPKLVSNSNACYFYTDGLKNGYRGGIVPKPGAIICWGYYGKSHGNPGHVAFVEKVNMANGKVKSIEVSQSGWSGGALKNVTLYPGNGKKGTGAYKLGYNNSYFNGFIYNKVDFGNPAGAVDSTEEYSDENISAKTKEWYISRYGTGAEVYFELQKYGYSHKACCAVLGNMQQESNFRVYTNGSYDGNGSEGLCQWTFGRKRAMQTYAASHSASGSWKSVDGQVAYLVYELEHTEKAANKVLYDDSLSLNQMTEQFEKKFERAGVPNMPARIKYANEWNTKMAGAESALDGLGYSSIDMAQRISKLYSSDNYSYINQESSSNTERDAYIESMRNYMSNVSFSNDTEENASFPESIIGNTIIDDSFSKKELIRTPSKFSLSEALVQAPFIELDIDGYIIGSYRSSTDNYPNYISRLEVSKTNGEINKYTIGLIYQIRPGEDPNLLDKLFSKVRYSKICIRYGDCQSGSLFKDTEAIITNIVANRDYTSSRISYTIYVTSACNYVTSVKFDFPSIIDKPSNIIRNLLYSNTETSQILLDIFPGMRDVMNVDGKGFIPTNDAIINVNAKTNIDVISYINYLVGCMSNVTNNIDSIIRNSSYYITYIDDTNGSYFKINELRKTNSNSVITNNLFEVTVGYPDGNDIYDFRINNNESWSMLYSKDLVSNEYVYDINADGDTLLRYSPNVIGSTNILNEIQKNWWTQVTTYPISAQLTMRGLLKPISLMDYVKIDVVFYGQKHLTSGLYAITGQQDSLSGSGFLTTLSLLRVGD